ncbi:3',5'-cyclic-nucleotide phosphodiesterase [Marinobacterium lacunae]|uniref:3',5'-cyclic-nucleotide phosphodiesterase n=1 Tax=Marinobacterium lacunae TaxID=1232683 RepID=A0A081G2C6_9GAMM|nr:phosphodiesterase [Marinobacterium lacunae]KEA64931.1 3',5'-cyclic-nucleotide phosphodiesterase [Marinobacterium lacunae]
MAESTARYLLQISDCHLMPDAGQRFRGLDTDETLRAVVAHAKGLDIDFDHVLLSGDLVHHGAPDAYRRLLQIVSPLPGSQHWIPGNHDERAAMRAASERPLGRELVRCGAWDLLLLDSTDAPDGRGSGSLSASELEWLDQTLAHSHERPALIVLHHNPVVTGSAWQDPIMLGNADAFARIVDRHARVRGIICGHLHQHQALRLGQVPVWSAPSTGIQFKPGQRDFMLEDDPVAACPGYCVYRLSEEGGIEASVHRVEAR